jgi:Ca2+-binding EF-hand superfamily protein
MTLKHLVWSLVLLMMLIYVFALLFARAMLDSIDSLTPDVQEVGVMYWGDLFASAMTLFQSVTGGLSWIDCLKALRAISPVLELVFVLYITITCLAVLNVITGTFCQSAMAAAESDPDLIAATLMVKKEKDEQLMYKLFHQIDHDGSGKISYTELKTVLEDYHIRATFATLGLDGQDAWTLFRLLDADRTDMIDVAEFINGCKRLSGVASTLDIAKLGHEIKWLVKKIAILVSNDPAEQVTELAGGVQPRITKGTTDHELNWREHLADVESEGSS